MQAKNFPQTAGKRVQYESAVRVDDAFRTAGGPGSKTHSSAVVFVEGRVLKIVAGLGQQFFIVQKTFRDTTATVRNDNDFFERGRVAKLFVNREEDVVNDEEAIAGVIRDSGNFVGMKPQVQRMQNAACAGDTKKGFEVAAVVPHHGGDAVTGLQAEFRESGREAARPAIEFAIARANDGLVRLARDDFDARKDLRGALQDGGQRQREIHHGAAHRASWQEIRL